MVKLLCNFSGGINVGTKIKENRESIIKVTWQLVIGNRLVRSYHFI